MTVDYIVAKHLYIADMVSRYTTNRIALEYELPDIKMFGHKNNFYNDTQTCCFIFDCVINGIWPCHIVVYNTI